MSLILLLISFSISASEVWKQDLSKMDVDTLVYKGQNKSTIQWKEINPYKWLDFDEWKKTRAFRDKNPYWKMKLRQRKNIEKMAAVIKCVGKCTLDHGNGQKEIQYNSGLFEGDEIFTHENSSMWITLINGTIIRLYEKTSISLNEINLLKDKTSSYIRLNSGHIYLESRFNEEYTKLNLPESDQLFLPLEELVANREYFQIEEFRKLKKHQKPLYEGEKNPGALGQYTKLNEALVKKDQYLDKAEHLTLINSPNALIQLKTGRLNFSYYPNGNSFIQYNQKPFNIKSKSLKGDLLLKGHNEDQFKFVSEGNYIATNDKIIESENYFKFSSRLTKRIPSILLAREEILKRKFPFLYFQEIESKGMILDYGYILWPKKIIDKREEFLTINLLKRELKNFSKMKELFATNDSVPVDSNKFNSIKNKYYKAKKSSLAKKIREFSDNEYYVWVMQNAK